MEYRVSAPILSKATQRLMCSVSFETFELSLIYLAVPNVAARKYSQYSYGRNVVSMQYWVRQCL